MILIPVCSYAPNNHRQNHNVVHTNLPFNYTDASCDTKEERSVMI